jgi:ferritin-like metal-binding protein YciE
LTNTVANRIENNRHIASDFRRRLEARHATSTATRKMLDRLSDEELVMAFLKHEDEGRDHVKQRAERGIE